MPNDVQRRDIDNAIRAKLIELVRLAAAHGIRSEPLMSEALDICDAEPPFSD